MANNFLTVQAQKFKLAGAGITSSATTIILQSFKTPAGTNIVTSDFGALGLLVLDPGTSSEETVSFTTVTQNADGTATLTGVTRGLGFTTPYTNVSGNQKAHAGGSVAVLSNPAAFYYKFTAKDNDETISGLWTVPTPTSPGHIANKAYVDAFVSGGSISIDALSVAGTAGETIANGQIVYFKASDSRWWLADADSIATIDDVILGVAQGSGTAGNAITGGVLLAGVDNAQSGLSAGAIYYISNTAGGISSSAGTNSRVIGQAKSTTELYFDPRFYNNRFLTSDGISATASDQSQTTTNATIEAGEANSTTRKNSIAQSFIGTKTKLRGVILRKKADTGTFTGTVTIGIKADSGGSPTGSYLASTTFTNLQWSLIGDDTDFETIFSSELTLTASTTYHIHITTSTSDTSNHPNFGYNTAGGYALGALKYNNTTDGWVTVVGGDLYFETLEGKVSQVAKSDTAGVLKNFTKTPVITVYTSTGVSHIGDSTTQFDITNPSGTTFRYTWDTTGTNPNISASTIRVGQQLAVYGANFASGNQGYFQVTGVGSNYFEVTNASGVVESNKTIGGGYINKGTFWTKPENLAYIRVRVVGSGGGGASGSGTDHAENGGGAGGYSEKIISASSLNARESVITGSASAATLSGKTSGFGAHCYATGGGGGSGTPSTSIGGLGFNGDVNIPGAPGNIGADTSSNSDGGAGGSSVLGAGGIGNNNGSGGDGLGYGGGGGGGGESSGTTTGGTGSQGAVIVEEFY